MLGIHLELLLICHYAAQKEARHLERLRWSDAYCHPQKNQSNIQFLKNNDSFIKISHETKSFLEHSCNVQLKKYTKKQMEFGIHESQKTPKSQMSFLFIQECQAKKQEKHHVHSLCLMSLAHLLVQLLNAKRGVYIIGNWSYMEHPRCCRIEHPMQCL